MAFKTQAEIWEHLLKNGKVQVKGLNSYLFLKNGMLTNKEGYKDDSTFSCPEQWSIYEEPKPKKKVTLYNYLYDDGGNLWESGFTTKSFDEINYLCEVKLLKTESKEVEYDDV